MTRMTPVPIPPLALVGVLGLVALAGCLGDGAPTGAAEDAPEGLAVVRPGPDDGVTVRLEGTGWARLQLVPTSPGAFHVHAARADANGSTSVHDLAPDAVPPEAYLSITLFATADDGDPTPMYDMILWGFPPELREKTDGPAMLGFENPGSAQLRPEAPGVLVVATNMDGIVLEVVADGAASPSSTLTVRPVAHPGVVARYFGEGTPSNAAAAGPVAAEDREEFPDVPVVGRGLDAGVVWQSGEGGARYGSMVEEMGRRGSDGRCSGQGFTSGLFLDEDEPTGPTPALGVSAFKGWTADAGSRALCAAVMATMVGDWERTGRGAWLFHSPFEPAAS